MILILFRETFEWVAQLEFASIDHLCGKKISGLRKLQSDRQTKKKEYIYTQTVEENDCSEQNNKKSVLLPCYLNSESSVIRQLVVYSEYNINRHLIQIFDSIKKKKKKKKKKKTITCMSNTTTKEN